MSSRDASSQPAGTEDFRRQTQVRNPAANARAAAGLLLLGSSLLLPGQTNFYTLTANGTAAKRLNIVFLAEGYTSSQFGTFLTNATNTANFFLSTAPFAEYASYFNCYAIAVASAQSGSDHPGWPQFVNTYFNSSYDLSWDTLITIPADASGQGKVDALLNTFMPAANLAVLLVNDLNPGGSDGGGRTAISAIAPNSLAYKIGRAHV